MRYRDVFRLRHDSLWGSRRGAVAVLFALTLVPLIIGAGMATDFARIQILKSSLQTIADSSALAGASELNQNAVLATGQSLAIGLTATYFKKGYTALNNGAFTTGPPVSSSNTTTIKYTLSDGSITTLTVGTPDTSSITVTATAPLNMTFMSLFTATQSISVFAKAHGAGYLLKIFPNSKFGAGAADSNTIFYYNVPTDVTTHPLLPLLPSILTPLFGLPVFTNYTALFSNNPTYKTLYGLKDIPIYIPASAGNPIAFALFNITGWITPYGLSSRYGLTGSSHWFFSNLAVPSMDPIQPLLGYTIQPPYINCSTTKQITGIPPMTSGLTQANDTTCHVGYPCVTNVGGVPYQNNLMITDPAVSSSSVCSTPTSGTLSCLQADAAPKSFNWGDMGGDLGHKIPLLDPPRDDFDYDDADYTVQCVPDTLGTASNVVLVQ